MTAYFVRTDIVCGVDTNSRCAAFWLLLVCACTGCTPPPPARVLYAPRVVRQELKQLDARIGDPLLTAGTERDRVLAWLDALLDKRPKTYLALERRAELRLAWGDAEGALADVSTLLEEYGKSADHVALRGRAFYQQGRPEAATEAFQEALRMDKKNTAALLHLGMILAEHRRFADARKYFDRVLEIDPTHRSAQSYAGVVTEAQGDVTSQAPDAANEQEVGNTAWRHESDPLDLKRGGLLLLKAGEDRRATEILLSAVHGLPRDMELLRACATGFTRQGKDAAALEILLHAARVSPEDAATQFFLGVVAERLSSGDERAAGISARAFAAVAKIDPTRADAHVAAARAHARRGDLESAVSHFDSAVAVDDAPPYVFLDYGLFLAEERDWASAARAYEDGLRRFPLSQNLQASLMVAYFHEGELRRARALRKMLEATDDLTGGARSLLTLYRGEIGP